MAAADGCVGRFCSRSTAAPYVVPVVVYRQGEHISDAALTLPGDPRVQNPLKVSCTDSGVS